MQYVVDDLMCSDFAVLVAADLTVVFVATSPALTYESIRMIPIVKTARVLHSWRRLSEECIRSSRFSIISGAPAAAGTDADHCSHDARWSMRVRANHMLSMIKPCVRT